MQVFITWNYIGIAVLVTVALVVLVWWFAMKGGK